MSPEEAGKLLAGDIRLFAEAYDHPLAEANEEKKISLQTDVGTFYAGIDEESPSPRIYLGVIPSGSDEKKDLACIRTRIPERELADPDTVIVDVYGDVGDLEPTFTLDIAQNELK